jgi:hypothetical protein
MVHLQSETFNYCRSTKYVYKLQIYVLTTRFFRVYLASQSTKYLMPNLFVLEPDHFQLFSPLIFLIAPVGLYIYIAMRGSGPNQLANEIGLFLLALYGSLNATFTIFFVGPYRFVYKMRNNVIFFKEAHLRTSNFSMLEASTHEDQRTL